MALNDRIKLYAIMIKSRERLAKSHGLDVRKVDVSGNKDMLEQREERIALLTGCAESHSTRSILCSIGPENDVGHKDLPTQRLAVELLPSKSTNSE
ncbi:MAG: hypothetical protein M3160_00670 [Candidatus Eremiobacteraeota bacterium]|nr:hypothetical protein [Candidatus Eremiobacteraeota bacterium]